MPPCGLRAAVMIQGEAWVDRGATAQDAYRLMLRHHIAPALRELGFPAGG